MEPGAGEAAAPDQRDAAPAGPPPAHDTSTAAVHRPSSLASLKVEIARAMQVAADRERERIDGGLGEEETAQVEKILARASAEAAELSRHADEDVSVVNAWYKDEVKRIRAEADRQIEERRAGLEQSLTHHGSLIEAEIESVHVALQGYRTSLGTFFGRLAEEREPSEIARLAGDLPDPPDLDAVRAEARSGAMQALEQGSTAATSEPAGEGSSGSNGRTRPDRDPVPVMDPAAAEQGADALSGTAILAAVPAVPADAGSTDPGTSAEAPDAAPNVAVRVIRALTSRTSPAEASEDR